MRYVSVLCFRGQYEDEFGVMLEKWILIHFDDFFIFCVGEGLCKEYAWTGIGD